MNTKLNWSKTSRAFKCSSCGNDIQPYEQRIVLSNVTVLDRVFNLHFHVGCFDSAVQGCGYF